MAWSDFLSWSSLEEYCVLTPWKTHAVADTSGACATASRLPLTSAGTLNSDRLQFPLHCQHPPQECAWFLSTFQLQGLLHCQGGSTGAGANTAWQYRGVNAPRENPTSNPFNIQFCILLRDRSYTYHLSFVLFSFFFIFLSSNTFIFEKCWLVSTQLIEKESTVNSQLLHKDSRALLETCYASGISVG